MAINNAGLWPYKVRVGDVLKDKNGNYRIVRGVRNGKSGLPAFIDLSIMRCSWTGRPYTVKSYIDCKHAGLRPVEVRVRLDKEIDRALAKDLERGAKYPKLTCCDVVGVIS